MRLGGFLVIAALASALTGCGKFLDKFNRINGDVTRVYFSSRNGEAQGLTALNGGLMIYFINQEDTNKGQAFGFSTEDYVNTKSVLLPNGRYKVYAYGWAGTNKLEGTVRCGYGDLGSDITLAGSATTVTIALDQNNCNYGSLSAFGPNMGGNDTTATNFKKLKTRFCLGEASTCTDSTVGSYYMTAEILGGTVAGAANFTENSEFTLASGCSSANSGGTAYVSTDFILPLGGNASFTPPVRIKYFYDTSCTNVSGTFQFSEGLKKYIGAASPTSYLVDLISTANSYYLLSLTRYF